VRFANANEKNNNGSPEGRLVGGLAEFGNDVFTLLELQIRLTKLDLRECLSRALIPLVLIVVGAIVALGTVPVALFGIAELLAAALKISLGAALLLTAGGALVLAFIVMVVAALRLGPSLASFRRSQEEFSRNLAWIRTVILYSGRSVPRRRI